LRAAIDTTMEAQSQMDDIVDEMPIDSSEPETPAPLFVIRNHKLVDVPLHPSPNFGGVIEPQYLIIHYTANGSMAQTIKHFNSRASQVSAHIVIDRDGTVVQCVSFDREAWHCGISRWDDLIGMNRHSIGIELVNWGRLKMRDGKFYAWQGTELPESETVWLPRKVDGKSYFWHTYTDEQVHACFDVAAAIVKQYGLMGILGHDDISPRRKDDPGPAFDMAGLREYVARKNGLV
jgi:N-acetylmuramoyl-L-alanine amidase